MSVVQLSQNQSQPQSPPITSGADYLVEVIQRLSLAQSFNEITAIVRHAARELVGADGATFVLRDGELCHYIDEEAIAPLWKGRKFPLESCVSGWAMIHRETLAIDDIYNDARVPHAAYRPTFVKSLVMTPIRSQQPIGAIGTFWSTNHVATHEEKRLLKSLADSTAIAIQNLQTVSDLKRANEAFAESIRTRDEFLSVAAHELRTPLSSLQLQLQMTKQTSAADLKGTDVGSEIVEDLTLGLRQVNYLTDLVERLLDVSRIRLDQANLSRTSFAVDGVVREAAERMRHTLNVAGCSLTLELGAPGISVTWDRTRIEQALTNLLSNAVKYAPGHPVVVKTRLDGGDIAIEVSDGGPGIASAFYETIFDRFVRVSAPNHVSGLGLGLFIVRSIARAHGGDAKVQSAGERGATFTLALPVNSEAKAIHDAR